MWHNWLKSLSSARSGSILALESSKRSLEADVDDAIAADIGSALDRDSPENCDEEYWEEVYLAAEPRRFRGRETMDIGALESNAPAPAIVVSPNLLS